jgi:hypothetical protein
MTRLLRRWGAVYCAVQLGGLAAMWLWPHTRGAAGFLWGAALIALFPGNILSTTLIEKLFWETSLSSTAMLAIELPLILGINALLWLIVLATIRKLLGQRSTHASNRSAAK